MQISTIEDSSQGLSNPLERGCSRNISEEKAVKFLIIHHLDEQIKAILDLSILFIYISTLTRTMRRYDLHPFTQWPVYMVVMMRVSES